MVPGHHHRKRHRIERGVVVRIVVFRVLGILLVLAALMCRDGVAVEHREGDPQEHHSAGDAKGIDRDPEEAKDHIPGQGDGDTHHRRIEQDHDSHPALLGDGLRCRQGQEDRQIDKRIHDREQRAEKLRCEGNIHEGVPY
jgi:hypothetical protein